MVIALGAQAGTAARWRLRHSRKSCAHPKYQEHRGTGSLAGNPENRVKIEQSQVT
jgi:hypothetical protein